METSKRSRKANRLRDRLSTLESLVVNLEKSMGDVRETLEVVKGHTNGLDSMKEQLREFVLESLDSSVDVMKGVLNSTTDKLTVRDDAFDAMHKVDVLNPKEFIGTRSARYVDNFLWRMEKYFCAKGIMDDATMTWKEFQSEFKGQFYLEYVKDDARAKLRQLTQKGIIREDAMSRVQRTYQIHDCSRVLNRVCSKRKTGDEEPDRALMRIDSIMRSIKAKRVRESEKKLME
ncbi:hypothetical protein Godav_005956 [Gossypium davidsonii]|uniref:Retrotransposon gag domain-containing protein n=1 Tax=Gossypium davidsonii TaxID=34287 RepID=A0A7J8S2N6_GOSDV|nr:hypothetical protein [Gossypium davidsonii]